MTVKQKIVLASKGKIVLLKMMRTARHAKASQGKHSSKFLTAMALLFKWWRLETRRD